MIHRAITFFLTTAITIISLAGCDGPGPFKSGGFFDPCLVDNETAIGRIEPVQTEDTFENKVLDSSQPVLVYFYQSACPVCKKLVPRLSNVADSLRDMTFCRTNASLLPTIAHKYNVQYYPTMVLFRNGMEVHRWVGLYTEDEMRKEFTEAFTSTRQSYKPVTKRKVCTSGGFCTTIVDDPILKLANIDIPANKE